MILEYIQVSLSLREHPKTEALAERIGPRAWVHLVALWLSVGRSCPDGDLSDVSDKWIARKADWEGDPAELVAALTECGFLSTDRLVCGWDERYDSTKIRRKREAERSKVNRQKSRSREESVTDAHVKRTRVHDPRTRVQSSSAGVQADVPAYRGNVRKYAKVTELNLNEMNVIVRGTGLETEHTHTNGRSTEKDDVAQGHTEADTEGGVAPENVTVGQNATAGQNAPRENHISLHEPVSLRKGVLPPGATRGIVGLVSDAGWPRTQEDLLSCNLVALERSRHPAYDGGPGRLSFDDIVRSFFDHYTAKYNTGEPRPEWPGQAIRKLKQWLARDYLSSQRSLEAEMKAKGGTVATKDPDWDKWRAYKSKSEAAGGKALPIAEWRGAGSPTGDTEEDAW